MTRPGPITSLCLLASVLAVGCLGLTRPAEAVVKRQWIRQMGTADGDYAAGVAVGPAGNVYVVGNTAGSFASANTGNADAWLAKIDAANHVLWRRQLGTVADDTAVAVATDASGDLYVAGNTTGSLGSHNQGMTDAWLAKYNAAGSRLWIRQLGTTSDDLAYAVAADRSGNVYLAGVTKGSLGGANGGGTDPTDAWLAKYDTSGKLIWTLQSGTDGPDAALGVATDRTGNVYLVGATGATLSGLPQDGSDAWVAKYNADGALLWQDQIGTNKFDEALGVTTDAAGHVFIAGVTYGSLAAPYAGGNGDMWVRKYAAAGHVQWTQQFGTINNDWAYGVAADGAGNVTLTGLTGFFQGTGQGTYYGDYNALLVGYDATGHLLWQQQLGTDQVDEAHGVATDTAGNLYVAGITDGDLCGGNRGKRDMFLAKFSTAP